MQFKLCCILLQQVRVWLLWQRLGTEKNPDSQNFLKLSAEEKDQYLYINMSSYYISNYVVTLTAYI